MRSKKIISAILAMMSVCYESKAMEISQLTVLGDEEISKMVPKKRWLERARQQFPTQVNLVDHVLSTEVDDINPHEKIEDPAAKKIKVEKDVMDPPSTVAELPRTIKKYTIPAKRTIHVLSFEEAKVLVERDARLHKKEKPKQKLKFPQRGSWRGDWNNGY